MNDEIRHDDRRLFSRFSAKYPAKFKDERDEFGQNVYLRNASAFGAQLASRNRLFLNDKIAIEVKLPDGTTPLNLKGEVVWIRKSAPGFWDVGLRFHKVDLMHLSRLYKFDHSLAIAA